MKYTLHIALILFTIGNLAAQNESSKTQVIIKQADRLYRDDRVSDAQVLQGNVIFEHDGALMYCDSALIFQQDNSLEAYGNIKVNQGDTVEAGEITRTLSPVELLYDVGVLYAIFIL